MTCMDDINDLTRLPGLFRRWELPDVLDTRRTYRLEEAGAHADGTPLVAVYTNPTAPPQIDSSAGADDGTPKASDGVMGVPGPKPTLEAAS